MKYSNYINIAKIFLCGFVASYTFTFLFRWHWGILLFKWMGGIISRPNVYGGVWPEHHGRVHGYRAGVTPTKLCSSSSSRMHDLEKQLQESEHKRLKANVELKEEIKHLKSMLEQQAIQMVEQRRHFEEQEASQMAEQRTHYDNMMMQMLSYITSQSTQSSSDH